jgi:3-oxoacyl-[acyl-carrier protein] reductase
MCTRIRKGSRVFFSNDKQEQEGEMKKLEGKVAVVTGASKGIGAAIAKHLAAEGASVVVNYASDSDGAGRVVSEIEDGGGKAVAVGADLSKKSEIERLFSEANKTFGRIDILVNNAAIYEFLPLEEIHQEHFNKQFTLNVLGPIFATQEAVKYIGTEGGSVINISSLASSKAVPSSTVYSATKGALDTVTRNLALELGPRKIRVNSINPGMVVTEGTTALGVTDPGSELRSFMEASTPLGRIGQPEDIGPAAVFLASDDSAWITGETWVVAGGMR